MTYSIHTVRVELYESSGDYVRLVLEILLTIWVCIHLFSEFWAIIQARRRQVSSVHPVLTTQLAIPAAHIGIVWQPANKRLLASITVGQHLCIAIDLYKTTLSCPP